MRNLLLIMLVFCGLGVTQTVTPNLKLNLPARGTQNWDGIINQNFTVLDTFAGTTSALYQGVWVSGAVYSKGQFVQASGILYMSLINANIGNTPATSPGAWIVVLAPGTVTSVSAGNLSPLFTTNVANAGSNPSITFTLSTAAAHSFYGNTTGGTATPGFFNLALGDLPGTGAITVNTTAPLGGGGALNLGGTLTLTCSTCLTAIGSGPFQLADGSVSAPAYSFSGETNTGAFRATASRYAIAIAGVEHFRLGNTFLKIANTDGFVWSSGTDSTGAADTGISRCAANQVCIGTGGTGAFDGGLKLNNINFNGASGGSGAVLTVGGTSGTTGGMSIFNGAAGSQSEMLAVYPADAAAAATRMYALSIRNLSIGFLSGSEVTGISHTGVATGLTMDAEGTGNVITIPVKVWLPAAGCNNATASTFWDLPTATPAAAACVTGTNTQKGVLDYADTAGGFSAQMTELLPADFSGNIDARIIWFTTATTGNVKWSLSTICTDVSATATDDPAFNTASTVTTAAPGTANRIQTSSISAVTITGCTAGQLLHVKLFRDGNDGADTIAATARFYGLELTIRRAM